MRVRYGSVSGTASGSVIDVVDGYPVILTAAHNLYQPWNGTWVYPDEVIATIGGESIRAQAYYVNEKYIEQRNDPQQRGQLFVFDEGVVVLPKDTQVRNLRPIATSQPKPGDKILISGFGRLSDDQDSDGVDNARDLCNFTPNGKEVSTTGTEIGCAIDGSDIKARSTSSNGQLREGWNTILRVEEGEIYYEGSTELQGPAGQIAPARGDSGGAIINESGELVGIISGGHVRRDGPRVFSTASENDITDQESGRFVLAAKESCLCKYGAGSCQLTRPGMSSPLESRKVEEHVCDISFCRSSFKETIDGHFCGGRVRAVSAVE